MATGCVKIVKRAKEFDPSTGKFIPEEKRAKSVDLFKGRGGVKIITTIDNSYQRGELGVVLVIMCCTFQGIFDFIHAIPVSISFVRKAFCPCKKWRYSSLSR